MTATPHDALFKATFSQIPHAIEELRHVLPTALLATMDFSTLTVEPGSFVDEALRARYTDLLYSLKLDGRDARVYVLFEHQSSADAWMPLRLLRYMMDIWEGCIAAGATRLPVVIPVMLHHSDSGWTAATRFEALFDLPPAAAEFTPHFGFALDDLGATSEADLRERTASAYTRLVLSVLQQSRSGREVRSLLRNWTGLIRDLLREPDGRGALRLILQYLLEVRGAGELVAITTTVREIDAVSQELMQTIAQMLESRGVEKGRQEGQSRMLLRLLHRRFGELPVAVSQRVEVAEAAELERWAEQLLAAGSLDELFRG